MLLTAFCHPPSHALELRRTELTKTIRIMKLTGILCLMAFLQVSAGTRAQTVTYSAKTTPLVSVFAAIEQQTGYVFFYNSRDLEGATPVTVSLRQVPLKEALEQILAAEPVTFDIQGNTIAITRKAAVAQVNTNNTPAPPPGEVHGHITDSLGRPLEVASVVIKGEKHGVQTDKNGDFVLRNVPDNATLIISSIGYESQTIKLTPGKEIRISLRASQSQLDETVVKGYYTTTDRFNTGDVTTVKGETINEQPVSDPILALEGRVPGLYIQQTSGAPGAYSTIRIRGQNSIANGNDPLYIVDGVPFSSVSLNIIVADGAVGGGNANYNANGGGLSPFNALNPADIESIVVLKDADATAIYGSRGANGVILITTKHGKAGTTRFDLNVYSGGGEITKMLPVLNTSQYLAMRHEAYQNDGITSIPSNAYDINGVWDTTRYTNWQKVLIGNTADFTNVQGSVSGGNANTQFLVGAGYSNQGTAFLGDYFDQKISANVKLAHTSTDQKFHLQIGVNYVYDNNNLPSSDFTNAAITLAPDAPALYNNSSLNWQIYNGGATFGNPAAQTLLQSKAATDNLISNLNLAYDILPGLKLSSSFGYNYDEMHSSILHPASSEAPPNNTIASNRYSYSGITTYETWIVEPQLNYKLNLGAGRLETLIGTTFQQNQSNAFAFFGDGFSSDALISDLAAASTLSLEGVNNTLYRYNAIYGRFSYDWSDKYLVNMTARRDGSSRFGPGKQFGDFGSAGIGWIFSKERLIQDNLPFLSFGKLRASYGITGNDQITPYQYLSTYTPLSPSYEGITGLYPTSISNPYFAWEVVKKMEGGIDLGFMKDRILVSASYFRDRTGNQLVGEPLPTLTGFTTVQENLPAIVQNTGLEMTLTAAIIKEKNFSWTISGNLTVPSNKLVAYPGLNSSAYATSYVVGKSLFIQELYHYTGVNPQTGLYSFATKNANGFPSYPTELYTTKPITQKYYGGFNNQFVYRGFALDIFIQYVDQLGYGYIDYYSNQLGVSNQNIPVAALNAWEKSGEQTSTQRFGTTGTTANPFYYLQASDGVITNTSFLRLKNLALSYQLPISLKSRLHLQNVKIYAQCQNLFTITKYQGMDPETGGFNLPPLRMVTAGLQVGF
jgi:TonB-linked SusC/RagA family outer membrane protein